MQVSKIPASGVITRKAAIDIEASIEAVFKYISAEESLTKFLKKYGPIHAIERHETHKGPWTMPGAYRTLYFESGDTLREELLIFTPHTYFAYSISEFTAATKYLADVAYGQFEFETRGDKTHVTWIYSFKPKNFLASIPLSIFMSMYFKKYMLQGLQISKRDIESAQSH
jgi:Polyketide cyclase / dehydrase and lipid transport